MGVSVNACNGRLRLVFRHEGKRKFLYLGLDDTRLNRTVAEGKAKIIEADLVTGNFDPSLRKYKPEADAPERMSVSELFSRYMQKKGKLTKRRSLEKYEYTLGHLREFSGSR